MTRPSREAAVVTWPLFWTALTLGVIFGLLNRTGIDSSGALVLNLLAVVASIVAMFCVMWVLEPVLMRGPRSQRTIRTVLLIILGGLARAAVLAALISSAGLAEARFGTRALNSVLLFTPTLALAANVVTLLRESAGRRAAFDADAARLTALEQDARLRTGSIRARAIDGIQAMLAERLAALRVGAPDDLGATLRADVDGVIRPLSHRMAVSIDGENLPAPAAPRAPRVRWSDVWRAASLGRPIRPLATATFIGLGSLVSLVLYSGSPWWGVAFAATEAALAYALLVALRRILVGPLRTMTPARRVVVLMASTTACLVLAAAVLVPMLIAVGADAPWRVPVAIMLVAPIAAWLLALDQGLRQQVAAARSEMAARTAQREHGAAAAQALAHHEERRLSRALHGPVQAAVTAAAMRVDAGDPAGAERLLIDAIGHLDAPGHDERGIASALGDISAAWDGLCTVEVTMAPDAELAIDASPPLASTVVDICTEACSNAVRHGDAEYITVTARRTEDALDLVVRDDGAAGEAAALPGLGSAMLDDVTLHWERRREDGTTVLRATLPCS